MAISLIPGEPETAPWRVVGYQTLAEMLVAAADRTPAGPVIVAVDGRSASGKSTVAARLQQVTPASALLHTDDLAWHEPYFGWGHLLAEEVLTPLRAGQALSFQPPQWRTRGRKGRLIVAQGLDVVFVEGVGASQRAHQHLIDATVWVQSDYLVAERRGLARDIASGVNGDADQAQRFWHEWMHHEVTFLGEQRPWERAAVIVNGTPSCLLADDQVEIATPAL